MELPLVENSEVSTFSSNDLGHHNENLDPQLVNHGDTETKCEITEVEVTSMLEVIAATGKFWHDWDMLKNLLSFRLKQVLAEYPEAQMVTDQQTSSLGETYPELVKRLDEALLCFIEGPPFTLQRLCEILLAARSIYPNLSKLALALEKNLLVTSTLTISTDPYLSSMLKKTEPDDEQPDKGSVEPLAHSSPLQNGVETMVGDEDEVMVEAEELVMAEAAEVDEHNKNGEKETAEEIVSMASETSSDGNTSSEPSSESSPSSEHLNSTS